MSNSIPTRHLMALVLHLRKAGVANLEYFSAFINRPQGCIVLSLQRQPAHYILSHYLCATYPDMNASLYGTSGVDGVSIKKGSRVSYSLENELYEYGLANTKVSWEFLHTRLLEYHSTEKIKPSNNFAFLPDNCLSSSTYQILWDKKYPGRRKALSEMPVEVVHTQYYLMLIPNPDFAIPETTSMPDLVNLLRWCLKNKYHHVLLTGRASGENSDLKFY